MLLNSIPNNRETFETRRKRASCELLCLYLLSIMRTNGVFALQMTINKQLCHHFQNKFSELRTNTTSFLVSSPPCFNPVHLQEQTVAPIIWFWNLKLLLRTIYFENYVFLIPLCAFSKILMYVHTYKSNATPWNKKLTNKQKQTNKLWTGKPQCHPWHQ